MKKLLFMCPLFVLFSCSEDVFSDVEKQNGIENNSNEMIPNSIDPAIPYESPFDNQPCCSAVNYNFVNNTDLDLHFSPYVGIARYDGADDYFHNGWTLSSANYPNLIPSIEDGEYFKLAECKQMNVTNFSVLSYNSSWQLPIYGGAFFVLLNSALVATETAFLTEYGKLYAINATITDPNNGNVTVRNNVFLKFPFLPQGITDPNQLSGDWLQLPTSKSHVKDLWYHNVTREICIGSDPVNNPGGGDGANNKPSELIFDYNGTTYILRLYTTSTDVVILLEYL